MDKLEIRVQILDDGTIRLENDRIPGPVHAQAEELLNELEKILGVQRQTTHKKGEHHKHTHVHHHTH